MFISEKKGLLRKFIENEIRVIINFVLLLLFCKYYFSYGFSLVLLERRKKHDTFSLARA